jgi:hypothetical protein
VLVNPLPTLDGAHWPTGEWAGGRAAWRGAGRVGRGEVGGAGGWGGNLLPYAEDTAQPQNLKRFLIRDNENPFKRIWTPQP